MIITLSEEHHLTNMFDIVRNIVVFSHNTISSVIKIRKATGDGSSNA